MRRITRPLLTLCLLMAAATPVVAQEDEEVPSPLDVLMNAFEAPEGQVLIARFIKEPTPGKSSIVDPAGDFEHSTGQEPGFTPDHVDITDTWALELDPGVIDLFGPTDSNEVWAPTGRLEVDPPGHPPFYTFTGDQVHDGGQYQAGALLFGFTLVETPPVDAPGRCEYVVWINDLARGATFVNNPNFPGDPATGTNIAFGLGLNPEDGPGLQSAFTLELQESGGFAPVFETDVRAFITPRYVGITVPRNQIGELGAINFQTFCVEEDLSFDPEVSGADQTGLTELTFDDLGAVGIETRDAPTEATTTTALPTTTIPTTAATTVSRTATDPGDPEEERAPEAIAWWLALAGTGLGIALLGWWFYVHDRDPCKKRLQAWKDAQEKCDQARAAAQSADDACNEAELEVEELETARKDLCRAWPPACWPTEEGDWVEDQEGNRITSRDIHMRKVALGAVWADYKAGNLKATEVEAKWREIDSPAFRQEMRETAKAYKELLEGIDADLAEAREELDKTCRGAIDARESADEACAAAEEARRAYAECIDDAGAAEVPPGAEADPTNPEIPGSRPAGPTGAENEDTGGPAAV